MKTVIKEDYPHLWPDLVKTAIDKMQEAKEPHELYSCLHAIEIIVGSYQFQLFDKRKPLEIILSQIFPFLENLGFSQIASWTKKSALILKIILKTLLLSIWLQIDEYYQPQELQNWMHILKSVLDRPLPEELTTPCESWGEVVSRGELPEWQLKKLCLQIISRIFYHTMTVHREKKNSIRNIKLDFLKKYSLGFVESCFQVASNMNSVYVSPKSGQMCLRSLQYACQIPQLFEKMQPLFERLLLDICIPLLKINQKDMEFWEHDQVQYIYSQYSTINDHNIIKNASKDLIEVLLKQISQNGQPLVYNFIEFIITSLRDSKNSRSGQPLTPPEREAILHALEHSYKLVEKHEPIMEKVEEILCEFIIPEMFNEHAVLRSRACGVFNSFGLQKIKNEAGYIKACEGICKNLTSGELPVQVRAAEALHTLIVHKPAQNLLENDLAHVLDVVVKLMNQIDLDELVNSLEAIIAYFSDKISPFATNLVEELCESFLRYKNNAEKQKESQNPEMQDEELKGEDLETLEAGESELAAELCLSAICNILKSNLSPKVLEDIAPKILTLLDINILSKDSVCVEKSLSFLNLLLYRFEKLNDHLLFYYPILCYLVIGKPEQKIEMDLSVFPDTLQKVIREPGIFEFGIFDLDIIVGCFLNFMSKAKEEFLSASDIFGFGFVDLLFKVVQKMGDDCLSNENDKQLCLGVRLFMGLLENFKGKIDNLLPKIFEIVSELMTMERSYSLKSVLVQAVAMMFWYNSSFTIRLLKEKGILKMVLEAWFKNVEVFTTDLEKEKELYGICGILALPQDEFPDVFKFFISFYHREVLLKKLLEFQRKLYS